MPSAGKQPIRPRVLIRWGCLRPDLNMRVSIKLRPSVEVPVQGRQEEIGRPGEPLLVVTRFQQHRHHHRKPL